MDLKRAFGRRFDDATRTLRLLDRFLQDQTIRYPDLNAATFQSWCQTQEHLASGVRRGRMREVYNFCLYRLRTEPQCFVPDPVLFPKPHQRLQPYITPGKDSRQIVTLANVGLLELSRCEAQTIRVILEILIAGALLTDQIYLYDAVVFPYSWQWPR